MVNLVDYIVTTIANEHVSGRVGYNVGDVSHPGGNRRFALKRVA